MKRGWQESDLLDFEQKSQPRFRLRSPKPPKPLEKHVVKACVEYLRIRGYWCQKQPVGTFRTLDGSRIVAFGVAGLPDYGTMHSFYPGFMIEFKRPGGELDPLQYTAFDNIRDGYRLAVVKIDSLEALIPWLDEHERKCRDRMRGP